MKLMRPGIGALAILAACSLAIYSSHGDALRQMWMATPKAATPAKSSSPDAAAGTQTTQAHRPPFGTFGMDTLTVKPGGGGISNPVSNKTAKAVSTSPTAGEGAAQGQSASKMETAHAVAPSHPSDRPKTIGKLSVSAHTRSPKVTHETTPTPSHTQAQSHRTTSTTTHRAPTSTSTSSKSSATSDEKRLEQIEKQVQEEAMAAEKKAEASQEKQLDQMANKWVKQAQQQAVADTMEPIASWMQSHLGTPSNALPTHMLSGEDANYPIAFSKTLSGSGWSITYIVRNHGLEVDTEVNKGVTIPSSAYPPELKSDIEFAETN
ncbi:MAG: hypothetical protein K6T83_15090 [Alicyclobacillus sp.]|nr:hypothetical protein [Alicyclobacillus sp.]